MVKNLGAILLSLVVCLAVMEVILRLAGISYPTFYRPDPVLGFSLRPGAQGWYRQEGEGYVEINADGFRGGQVPLEKQPGEFRVAVLGDSFALGLEVMEDETFSAQLQQRLQTCAALNSKKVSVLNFGAAGYGTGQEYLLYRNKARAYAPDVVVLAFFSGNDVRNNSAVLQADALRPYYRLEDDRLKLDNSFLTDSGYTARTHFPLSTFYDLVNHVRVLQVANQARQAIRYALQAIAQQRAASGDKENAGEEAGLDVQALGPPPGGSWAAAWAVTDALVTALADDVERDGAQFLLVSISNAIQVSPDAQARRQAANALGQQDLSYADRRVAALGQKTGFDTLALADVMQPIAEASGTYFHGFDNTALGTGHYNRDGHAFAAQAMANALCPTSAAAARAG